MIARVEPLTRTRAVEGPFDYRLRPEQAGVRVGSLLRVPFGRRQELGIVVELAGRSELAPDRLAEPDAVLPAGVPAGPGRAGAVDGERVLLDARALAVAGARTGRDRRRPTPERCSSRS